MAEKFVSLRGVVSLSLLFHGGVKLAHVRGYGSAPTKPNESRVYDHDGVSYLSCAQGSCISCSSGGYVMACMAFYGWGFGVPSHQFLCSLLWPYGLELHHLTPTGILHLVAFMTKCEANIGIEPHFNLWCYIFCA
jgi:hypothetical protein